MNIEEKILNIIKDKKSANISDFAKVFGFSRAYINKVLNRLIDQGVVVRLGKTNQTRYILSSNKEEIKKEGFRRIYPTKKINEDFVFGEIKLTTKLFDNLSDRMQSIVYYTFTEMLNNAIDHSNSEHVEVLINQDKDNIFFEINDKGVGIFEHVKRKKKLNNHIEALQDILKGKQTTDPERHSGEGIFFTSKVVDQFIIQSSNLRLIVDNGVDDIFVEENRKTKGTKVFWQIEKNSKKKLTDVFNKYTNKSLSFDKTEVKVDLFKINSPHISRSEAKRLLSGLDKFNTIILDFKDIDLIGQGFADEVFRVWQNKHSKIVLKSINTSKTVEMMINRAKNTNI
jgi:anti-sigma regulatory factor (Ser/Thr protein kinase)